MREMRYGYEENIMTEDELKCIEECARGGRDTHQALLLVKEIRTLRARAESAERIAHDLCDDLHAKDSYKTGVADERASVGYWIRSQLHAWPHTADALADTWLCGDGHGVSTTPPAALIARVLELEEALRPFVEAFSWIGNPEYNNVDVLEVTFTALPGHSPLNPKALTVGHLRRARDVLQRRENDT